MFITRKIIKTVLHTDLIEKCSTSSKSTENGVTYINRDIDISAFTQRLIEALYPVLVKKADKKKKPSFLDFMKHAHTVTMCGALYVNLLHDGMYLETVYDLYEAYISEKDGFVELKNPETFKNYKDTKNTKNSKTSTKVFVPDDNNINPVSPIDVDALVESDMLRYARILVKHIKKYHVRYLRKI